MARKHDDDDEKYEDTVCPTCYGTGEYHFRKCGLCGGKGTIRTIK